MTENNTNELLRFSTAGSVDDGKSTLIGRLLFDSKSIFEDQLEAIEVSTKRRGREGVDLALLTDGLSAEREQGITIDVAYRYFATPKRKFIIADTPGHEQYTRNMVTGASTAQLALILVDARKGVLPQSRRHAYISHLLGIKHIVVCVNKMDLVDYAEDKFEEIKKDFSQYVGSLNIPDLRFVPISALDGDNVVTKSENMSWYQGDAVLDILQNVEVLPQQDEEHFRFPVQYVNRPNSNFRGYAGTVAGGLVKPDQEVLIYPQQKKTKIKALVTRDGDLPEAFSPMSISLTLADEIDISRGDMIVSAKNPPQVAKEITAKLCWMSETELQPGKKYILKHCTKMTKAVVTKVKFIVDIDSLGEQETGSLKLNEIAEVELKVLNPIPVDSYRQNRTTGSFILIDSDEAHNTVAAGMVV
jgi:sulfate adenylyltransferase large subunit